MLEGISSSVLETPCAWLVEHFPEARLEPHYSWTHPDGTELIEYRFHTTDGRWHVVRVAADFLRGRTPEAVYEQLSLCGLAEAVRNADGNRPVCIDADGSILNA